VILTILTLKESYAQKYCNSMRKTSKSNGYDLSLVVGNYY